MTISTKSYSLIFLFLFSSILLFGQEKSGQIIGVVKDSTTGTPLFGTNIWLKGLSLGAASDMNGKYVIQDVPPGTYDLVARYIGYKQRLISVKVPAGKIVELNIFLTPVAIRGRTVTVTAQASGQKGAINQELTSNTIINVVSAERIHELPDASAAAALSRLPGISLMNGDQIVIRGVQAKMNQVLINGIEVPSTDMNDRATNLGFISSNLLSGIEVIKALTPDMDANTIGGVVNLRLREAPSGLHYDALAQGNYNSTDRVGDNYKFWASVSDRFLNDKLGVFLQGNLDRSDGGNQSASISPVIDGSGSLQYGQAVYHTSAATFEYDQDIVKNGGGSLILDYRLPNGKIIFQNTYSGNYTDQRNNQILLNFDNTQAVYTINRDLYGKDLWINALQAENNFGNIKVDVSLSHSYTQQYTRLAYQPYLNGGAAWTDFQNGTGFVAPFGVNAQGLPITYNSATAERQLSMSKVYGIFNNLNPADADSATLGGWVGAHKNVFNQHLYNASLDASTPVNFSKYITATFKAGGKYVRTTRFNNPDQYFSNGSDLDTYANVLNYFPGKPRSNGNPLRLTDVMETNFSRGKYFLSSEYNFTHGFQDVINTNIYDNWLKASMSGWSPASKHDDSWKNDWNGAEQFSAAYLMGTFNIGPSLTLLGGVRYESYNMQYHANFTFVTHSVYGDAISTEVGDITSHSDSLGIYHNIPYSLFNVNRTDVNYFPNIQLKYKVNDWSNIRLAYTTGISRPDYLSIIPKIAVYPNADYEVGNPTLKPTTVQNLDAVASFYSNAIGLLTIDAFYKELKNVMYTTQIYYGNLAEYAGNVFIPDSAFLKNRFGYTTRAQDIVNTSLNNPNPGYIRGVEIDWQTNFWYLPSPFNSLVLDVNYTKSGSNMDYRIVRNDPVQVRQPNGRYRTFYVTTDTVYHGRLIQQANDIVNVAIGVDYKGFSGRLSFNMVGNVLNNVGIRPEESAYTGNIYRWDFTIKQELPFDGLSIALNGVNIFHNGIKTYRNYRVNPAAPITKNLISVLYAPTIFQANLRYSF